MSGNKQSQLAVEGGVTSDATKKLLFVAGKDTTLLQSACHPGFKATPLDLKLTSSIKVKAVESSWPKWKEGSEFKATRESNKQ